MERAIAKFNKRCRSLISEPLTWQRVQQTPIGSIGKDGWGVDYAYLPDRTPPLFVFYTSHRMTNDGYMELDAGGRDLYHWSSNDIFCPVDPAGAVEYYDHEIEGVSRAVANGLTGYAGFLDMLRRGKRNAQRRLRRQRQEKLESPPPELPRCSTEMATKLIEDRKKASAWRDKILVNLRQEARSNVYRSAFGKNHGCAYGFLLGTKTDFNSPAIHFSLVCATSSTADDLWIKLDQIQLLFKGAKHSAKLAGVNDVGLFVAHDNMFGEHCHQLTGYWIDLTSKLHLPYCIIFPTLGHEAAWMAECFFASSYPHDALAYRTVRGKLSIQPRHNPRRVRSLWRQFLASGNAGS